jgi:integrase
MDGPDLSGSRGVFGPALEAAKLRPIAGLVPYARNSRTHSDDQVAQIARSMESYGWTVPVLVDPDGGIIAGHGRVLAAQKLGWPEVPCLVARGWTEDQKRLYVIGDNQLALNADWDMDVLSAELAELRGNGLDLSLAGFDVKQLAEILDPPPEQDPEAVPGLPGKPVSRRGDLYILGKHRILCGDSTNADDVAKVLDGAKPHLSLTRPTALTTTRTGEIAPTARTGSPYGARAVGLVTNDKRADWREAWALCPSDVIYCWHPPGANSVEFYHGLTDSGFVIRMQIIWNKSNFPIGRGDYHVKHEPCWYAVRKGKTGHWTGDRKQTTVWDIPKPAKSETTHRAYAADIAAFLSWGGAIPTTPQAVAAYLASSDNLAVSTLRRRLAAIADGHKTGGYPDPTKHPLVRKVFHGIRRIRGAEVFAPDPLDAPKLTAIIAAITDDLTGIRDRALLLGGFFCALRRSELVLLCVKDLHSSADGWTVNIRRSKTDQNASGQQVPLPSFSGPLCPKAALTSWLTFADITDGPDFRSIDKQGKATSRRLAPQSIGIILRERASAAGLATNHLSAHSLRSGFAVSAVRAGMSLPLIQAVTRHTSTHFS